MSHEADRNAPGSVKAAERHSSLVEAIAAGIAHEARNPPNALQINLGILEEEISELGPDRKSQVFELIRKIAGEARGLGSFVTEFLRFARPPCLNREPVAVPFLSMIESKVPYGRGHALGVVPCLVTQGLCPEGEPSSTVPALPG